MNLTALTPHLAGTIPPPQPVADVLRVLTSQPIPNEPNAGAQGSKRLVLTWIYGYAAKHGCLADGFDARARAFLGFEEEHRHLSEGGPPVKPATLIDAQHFEIVPHLMLGTVWCDPLAAAQASALVDWAVAWAAKYAPHEVNSRALMWPLGKMAEVQAVNLALGVHDDRPLLVAKAIVERLRVASGEENGVPYMTLNNHADPDDSGDGDGQADHAWCRVSDWMGGGRGAWATGLWLDVLPQIPGVPPAFVKQVKALHRHALRCLRYARELAEAQGAPLGGSVDDYDTTPPGDYYVHAAKDGTPKWDGVMQAFSVDGILSAKRHAPKHWDWLRPRLEAYYQRCDRYVWRPSKAGQMDHHSASVALKLGAEFGWRIGT